MRFSFFGSALPRQVWIQAAGRGLYQLGSAVLLFYMPIVFVNYSGFSATQVGLATSAGAVSGFFGNLLGGSLTDSPRFGRRKTLIVAGAAAMITALLTSLSQTLWLLVVANLFFGISTGLYWTAADAAVMDSTQPAQRQEAFSVLGVTDNLGFGLGTLGGGLLLARLPSAIQIFAAAAVLFALFTLLMITAAADQRDDAEIPAAQAGWKLALTDRKLLIYLLVNTLFITYMALVNGSLPLYFVNFGGTPELLVSNLFTWGFIGLGALVQVPVVKLLTRFSYLQALMLSLGIWGSGFLLVWLSGTLAQTTTWTEFGIFAVFAIAAIIYKPTSAAWIAELAPNSLRGIYTAIAYQCWAIGYVIGPIAGGWALDQSHQVTELFWLVVGLSTVAGLLVLLALQRQDQAEPVALPEA